MDGRKGRKWQTGPCDMRTTTFHDGGDTHVQHRMIFSPLPATCRTARQEKKAVVTDQEQPTTSFALFWAGMKDGEGPRVGPGGPMAPGTPTFFFLLLLLLLFCGCEELPVKQLLH